MIRRLPLPALKRLLPACLLLAALLTGCVTMSDPEGTQEYNQDTVGVVTEEQSLGQTFHSRRDGLNGITLWLAGSPGIDQIENRLTFSLFSTPEDSQPVYTQSVQIAANDQVSAVQINFQPLGHSGNQSYYLELSQADGEVRVKGVSEDRYSGGEAQITGIPVPADLAFRLTYDYNAAAVLQDILAWLSQSWRLIPLGLMLILPGWLLLSIAGLRERFDGGEQVALAMGLSLAVIPLVFLWTTIAGFHWSRAGLLVVFGALAGLGVWQLAGSKQKLRALLYLKLRPHWIGLALAGILLFSWGIRLAMVRDLAAPAWVDSVHHALITRLVMEQGGLPATYQPYINLESTQYHPGFHAAVAVFTWLSNLELAEALMWFGQALNALSVCAIYLLTTTLTKNPKAGLLAALLAGAFSPMPAYYASWGRYTQLAGLIILPVIIALARLALQEGLDAEAPQLRRWSWLLSGLAASGLLLVHYRVAAFLGCFLIGYSLSLLPWKRGKNAPVLKRIAGYGVAGGSVAVLISLPWLVPTLSDVILPRLGPMTGGDVRFFSDFSWRFLTAGLGNLTLGLAGLGLVLGLFQRKAFPLILAGWTAMMFFLANLDALRLPGAGFVNNVSVAITMFMPICVLGGYAASQVFALETRLPSSKLRGTWSLLLGILCLLGAFFGARQLLPLIRLDTLLARQADLPALQWIADNIPENETIVINPFLWGYGFYGGNDGGFWISALSGHKTIPPPVIYGSGDREDIQRINAICKQIINLAGDPVRLRAYLLSEGLHYLYIGARGGVFSPRLLAQSSLFTLLNQQDGTWLFEVLP